MCKKFRGNTGTEAKFGVTSRKFMVGHMESDRIIQEENLSQKNSVDCEMMSSTNS